VAHGANPSGARQQKKIARREASASTYKAVALEWLEKTAKARQWSVDHSQRTLRRLQVHFFPWLGRKPIADVTDDDVMSCLRRMEDRNLIDTAHRALSENDSLFRYAKKRKYVKHTSWRIYADLTRCRVRRSSTTPRSQIPRSLGDTLLRAIDTYHGGFVVRCALRLLPLVFVRPGELQWATWSEMDLDGAEWRIPAERMKMREYHIVPFSRQALAILRDLHPVSGLEGYVFPQARNSSRPISENTLNVALRGIGYTKGAHSDNPVFPGVN
jgi:integrase